MRTQIQLIAAVKSARLGKVSIPFCRTLFLPGVIQITCLIPALAAAAAKAGIKQVIWITPGKNRVLQNGIETFPNLADLTAAIS